MKSRRMIIALKRLRKAAISESFSSGIIPRCSTTL
nr:MAG TPA: hypothetical protein [Caudoviricetes sp.]